MKFKFSHKTNISNILYSGILLTKQPLQVGVLQPFIIIIIRKWEKVVRSARKMVDTFLF